ncbi:XRE family transcriptional regulator [Centipeda periodontii DSM 2778]|uniref:XRE family transcriptional regulator n=1 Tax=Centipeda periodontii DSM 2778 TaxID=888060 RepID=F5RMM2_9FIRM|nr:helix-turn-helix domain-containing protein [Centipeda periodontii]EGK59520.1 XRE family transcriptional regulator [Centipeda periodontii DSM 2778]
MNRMKLLREQHNLSQTDLAKILNISRQSYNFYENEKRDPDTTMLIRIADFFNVSLDYLLGQTNDPSPLIKEKTPSYQEEVLRDIEDITPEMASEVRQFINYLKHKEETAAGAVAGKK